eukprot:scaffold2.g7184.t1
MVYTPTRRPLRAVVVAAALCAVLFVCSYSYLSALASVAYTYIYWGLRPPAHYAMPHPGAAGAPAAPAAGAWSGGAAVPRILHQTWKSTEIPEQWRAAVESCKRLHPDFEYRLWTDADARKFIEEEYSWFLPTFLAYPYAIQRVDVVRYFILLRHGGLYIDLDMGCNKRLDFMLDANFTAPLTHPMGISNDIMAATPGAPFLASAVRQLPRWNKWMGIKYVQARAGTRRGAGGSRRVATPGTTQGGRPRAAVGAARPQRSKLRALSSLSLALLPSNRRALCLQVMFSTGPMFLTVHYALSRTRADVAVVPADVYGKYDSSHDPALYHLHGSSWHAGDAQYVLWLDSHAKPLALVAAGLAGAAALAWAGRGLVARHNQFTLLVQEFPSRLVAREGLERRNGLEKGSGMFKFNFGASPQAEEATEAPSYDAPAVEEALLEKTHSVPVEMVVVGPGLSLQKGVVSSAAAATALGRPEAADNDLLPGRYEGGFKQWEGGLDLAQFLALHWQQLLGVLSSARSSDASGAEAASVGGAEAAPGAGAEAPAPGGGRLRVLELGCGHGLPGLVGLHHGAEVHFQDYNPQVLHLLTMPNALANWCAWRATAGAAAGPPPPPPARFFSGSWASLEGLLARGGLAGGYDLVLTAETIYSPAAAAALLACVGACLRRPGGVALVAAKAYYFGCGGSLAGFLQAVGAGAGAGRVQGWVQGALAWRAAGVLPKYIDASTASILTSGEGIATYVDPPVQWTTNDGGKTWKKLAKRGEISQAWQTTASSALGFGLEQRSHTEHFQLWLGGDESRCTRPDGAAFFLLGGTVWKFSQGSASWKKLGGLPMRSCFRWYSSSYVPTPPAPPAAAAAPAAAAKARTASAPLGSCKLPATNCYEDEAVLTARKSPGREAPSVSRLVALSGKSLLAETPNPAFDGDEGKPAVHLLHFNGARWRLFKAADAFWSWAVVGRTAFVLAARGEKVQLLRWDETREKMVAQELHLGRQPLDPVSGQGPAHAVAEGVPDVVIEPDVQGGGQMTPPTLGYLATLADRSAALSVVANKNTIYK